MKPRDFLYDLLKSRHIEHWHRFAQFGTLVRLRVAMYVVSHGNRAKARDVIAALVDAGDSRSPETLARLIRYMKTDHFLTEDSEGYLSADPSQMRFVIKQVRGSLKDAWFLIALAISASASIINYVEQGFGTVEGFLVLITVLIFCKIVDDALHETTW